MSNLTPLARLLEIVESQPEPLDLIFELLEATRPEPASSYPEWNYRNAPEFGVYSVDESGVWHDCEPLERPGY